MDALYHEPRHPYTRLLFAATPDLYQRDAVVSIPGTPPRLDRDLVGCPFAPRCDVSFEACFSVEPRNLGVGVDHNARCHHNDPSIRSAS